MNKLDKIILMVSLGLVIGGVFVGLLALAELSDNKECYQTDFELTHIEIIDIKELSDEVIPLEVIDNPNNDYVIPQGEQYHVHAYKIHGTENGTNVTRKVIESLGIDKIRELFPKGQYIANYCPEVSQDLEIEYNLRGLMHGNKINKWIFK